MSSLTKHRTLTNGYCLHCSKIVWPSREAATLRVQEVKDTPGVQRPDLLNAYKCPDGPGWHIGHHPKR